MKLPCPYCFLWTESDVVDTRSAPLNRIYRRRVCNRCGRRFTTYEQYVSDPKHQTITQYAAPVASSGGAAE